MTNKNTPFWERSSLTFKYPGVRQVMATCVFAAIAGAVNYLTGRKVWTLGSLIDAGAKEHQWAGGPAIGRIAHQPVKDEIAYRFNQSGARDFEETIGSTVRRWIESEGRVVTLSCPQRCNGQERGWHMITLIEWVGNEDYFVAWDSNGRTAAVYEHEIEAGVFYRSGIQDGSTYRVTLDHHPDHHAFVWGPKLKSDLPERSEE